MHIPDGFISAPVSAGAALPALGSLVAALARASRTLKERLVPFAGLTAAFIFVLQMLNFPVAAGTSGHLIGGALAAILLGPWMGIVAVSVVVIVQALLFADGGITALGLNVLNMAVITVGVAWPVFRLLSRLLPQRSAGVLVASMVAAWGSVPASSIGFAIEYWIGGQGGVDPGLVFSAMVGVHALIGIGEGLITAAAIGAVLAVRPDLVAGAEGLGISVDDATTPSRVAVGSFVAAGVAVAVALVVFVAPFANPNPDGLERVAENTGFLDTAQDHPIGGPLADYGVAGIDNPWIGTAVAGLIGTGITFAAGMLLVGIVRRLRQREQVPASR